MENKLARVFEFMVIGVLECWNIGVLVEDRCLLSRSQHSNTSLLQYSKIEYFQQVLAILTLPSWG